MANFEQEKLDLQARVINYATGVQDGSINACVKTKWGVRRFFNDLKKTEKKDSDFYVDWNELLKFNRWSGMFKHSKGVVAGQFIELSDFQLYLATNIFCFKRRQNGYRRFREVYIQLARKNAKSQLLFLIVSYVAFLSDEQEEIYIAGWSKDQSNLVYNETLNGVQNCAMLRGKYSDSYHTLKVFKNGSIIKALSREARKTGDGTNPSLSVVDEYHAHQTNEIVDVQKSGMIARKSPLLVYITTAGFDLNSPCFEMYNYTSDILNPDTETENDDIFVAIYELDKDDDVKDERNWAKANPIVATYPEGMQSIRSELKIALDQPEKMRNFLTKNMNVWYEYAENGYMDLSKWNRCETNPSEMEAFMKGANVYLGIDLSMTTDLTAVGWVAVKGGKFMVGQHSFMPDAKYTERMSKDRTRYDVFRDKGYLTLTEGDIVDYFYVKEWVVDFCSKYNVLQIGFDKWNASHFAQDLMNDGYPMLEIPQSITQLSEPTKKFREAVYEGKVLQMGDSMLKWALNNAILKLDQQENVMIGKQVSKDRIDPIAAVINAFSRAMYDDLTVDLNTYIMSDNFSF